MAAPGRNAERPRRPSSRTYRAALSTRSWPGRPHAVLVRHGTLDVEGRRQVRPRGVWRGIRRGGLLQSPLQRVEPIDVLLGPAQPLASGVGLLAVEGLN